MSRAWGALLLACACSNAPLEVSRVVSPADAAQTNGTKLHAVAVLRGEGRAELPANAIVEPTRVRVPQRGMFDYALDPGELVLKDDKGRITAVRAPGEPPTETAFKPETATFDEEKNVVRGELALGEQRVPLLKDDRIEVRGTFSAGEKIPLGGEVLTKRATSALIFGLSLFAVSYTTSVVVAATSPHDYDQGLYVPIAGPWIAYAARPDCNDSSNTACGLEKLGLVLGGVLEAVGVVVFVVGLPTRTEVSWPEEKKAAIRLTPLIGTSGLGLKGEF